MEERTVEKFKMHQSAGGRDRIRNRIAGSVAPFACDVRSHKRSISDGNRDAMVASQPARVSLHRCQNRNWRGSELLNRDVEHPEYDYSRFHTSDFQARR